APLDHQLGKGAVAAADIEPAHSVRHADPVDEALADEHAPATHHELVAGTVIEADRRVGHWRTRRRLTAIASINTRAKSPSLRRPPPPPPPSPPPSGPGATSKDALTSVSLMTANVHG